MKFSKHKKGLWEMKYLLFKKQKECKRINPIDESYVVKVFTPHLGRLFMEEEKKDPHILLFRLYISVLTRNKTKIYTIQDGEVILHMSYVIPPNYKYPFLGRDDLAIGPCNTVPSARGKGLYPWMLEYIINDNKTKNFYMFIREENSASIKGVLKAGFVRSDGYIEGVGVLNRFIKVS